MIVADKVLLVGGSYDGAIVDFGMGRAMAMHDPEGTRPDELYVYNLDMFSEPGKIIIRSATYDGPGPKRSEDAP